MVNPSPDFQTLDQDRLARRRALRRAAYPSIRLLPRRRHHLRLHARPTPTLPPNINHLRLRHGSHLLHRQYPVPDLRAGRSDRIPAVPHAVAPYREPSLVGHVRERVLGETLASVLPPFFVVYGLRPGKKGRWLVPPVDTDLYVRSHLCCMYALLF